MRRHILLAVLLSLVVSLPRGKSDEANNTAPETGTTETTESNTETATATPEPPTSTTTESNTETATATPEPPTSTTTEDNTKTATATPEPTTSANTENNTETATATPEPPTSTTTGTNTTSSSATTPATAVCNPNPCGTDLAECIALHSNFTCECQYGFYYSENNCHQAKIFPGVITLNAPYSDDVQTVNSTQYEEVFQNITRFFESAFVGLKDFRQTIIAKIQSPKEVRASLSTRVTVVNLFTQNSEVDDKKVTSAIKKAEENSPEVSGYSDATYCDAYNCDNDTTECQNKMFPTCECRDNFSKTPWDVRSCSDCRKSCSDETHEYCTKEKGVPQCKCKPNFERKDGICVQCPVGYSGENCSNNSELILIIVGTVSGAIILSLVIAVSVVSVRAKHKQDPEKRSLMKSGYSNPNASDGRQNTMFPRVQTTSGHANPGYQPNNSHEMRSANRGHFPETDYADMYNVSREPGGFRMQSRY